MIDKKKYISHTGKLFGSEDAEQAALCNWLDKTKILYYAIPNGKKRHPIDAAKLKKTGVKTGVPDLCVPIANKKFHGLYLELKKQESFYVSHPQKKWIENLRQNGYFAKVAYGWEHAKEIIEHYLDDREILNDDCGHVGHCKTTFNKT